MRIYTRIGNAERFWAQVDKTTDPNGCWTWLGARRTGGYGVFRLTLATGKYQLISAHRYAYELQFGLIFPGVSVLHKPPCINRLCVRHLYLGTHSDNMLDMRTLGRSALGKPRDLAPLARGERHYNRILTDIDIKAIRSAYTGQRGQQASLARQYGVNDQTIYDIVHRRTWRHII